MKKSFFISSLLMSCALTSIGFGSEQVEEQNLRRRSIIAISSKFAQESLESTEETRSAFLRDSLKSWIKDQKVSTWDSIGFKSMWGIANPDQFPLFDLPMILTKLIKSSNAEENLYNGFSYSSTPDQSEDRYVFLIDVIDWGTNNITIQDQNISHTKLSKKNEGHFSKFLQEIEHQKLLGTCQLIGQALKGIGDTTERIVQGIYGNGQYYFEFKVGRKHNNDMQKIIQNYQSKIMLQGSKLSDSSAKGAKSETDQKGSETSVQDPALTTAPNPALEKQKTEQNVTDKKEDPVQKQDSDLLISQFSEDAKPSPINSVKTLQTKLGDQTPSELKTQEVSKETNISQSSDSLKKQNSDPFDKLSDEKNVSHDFQATKSEPPVQSVQSSETHQEGQGSFSKKDASLNSNIKPEALQDDKTKEQDVIISQDTKLKNIVKQETKEVKDMPQNLSFLEKINSSSVEKSEPSNDNKFKDPNQVILGFSKQLQGNDQSTHSPKPMERKKKEVRKD